jgi:hypothetical protein
MAAKILEFKPREPKAETASDNKWNELAPAPEKRADHLEEPKLKPLKEAPEQLRGLDIVSLGERSLVYRGDDGREQIMTTYPAVIKSKHLDEAVAFRRNDELASKLTRLVSCIASVDATNAEYLDDEEQEKYCTDTILYLLNYHDSEEARQDEVEIIDDYFDALDEAGNAFALLLYRTKERLERASKKANIFDLAQYRPINN